MKNRNTLVAALAGALVGITVGAGTYFSAQLVSYRYSDRDTFRVIRRQADLHPARTVPTRYSRHTAAGKRNAIPEQCLQYTRTRRTHCIEEARKTNE